MARSAIRFLLWAAFLLSFSLFLLGFAGRVHSVGDSLAVFRLHIAAGTVFWGVLTTIFVNRWAALPTVIAFLMAFPTLISYVPGDPSVMDTKASIYQKNLYFRLSDPDGIIQDILKSEVDIVLLQEVSTQNLVVLEQLREAYPNQGYCAFNRIGGTAVLSRWPMVGEGPICPPRGGMAALRLESPIGPVWAVALHLHWPWPYGQARHVRSLLPELERLEGPVIVGGDFNMVPWGNSVKQIAEVTGTEVVGPTQTTLMYKRVWMMLPIDHILLPKEWIGSSFTRSELGSDHKGVIAYAEW